MYNHECYIAWSMDSYARPRADVAARGARDV